VSKLLLLVVGEKSDSIGILKMKKKYEITVLIPPLNEFGRCSRHCPFFTFVGRGGICMIGLSRLEKYGFMFPGKGCPRNPDKKD